MNNKEEKIKVPNSITPAMLAVLQAVLDAKTPLSRHELVHASGTSSGTVYTVEKNGFIQPVLGTRPVSYSLTEQGFATLSAIATGECKVMRYGAEVRTTGGAFRWEGAKRTEETKEREAPKGELANDILEHQAALPRRAVRYADVFIVVRNRIQVFQTTNIETALKKAAALLERRPEDEVEVYNRIAVRHRRTVTLELG